jgi:hypothetical protein
MIETGIQNTVPGMIETGIQNTVPGMIETGIQNTVPKLIKETVQPMLDEAVSSLAQDTAEGFAEVHDKLDALSLDVHQLKDSQYDIRNRIDDHELRLQALGSMP